jgi:hypothetical protein
VGKVSSVPRKVWVRWMPGSAVWRRSQRAGIRVVMDARVIVGSETATVRVPRVCWVRTEAGPSTWRPGRWWGPGVKVLAAVRFSRLWWIAWTWVELVRMRTAR